jgi:murein DD-endopeptidase MepM/ murein hydrolase activator NlpD
MVRLAAAGLLIIAGIVALLIWRSRQWADHAIAWPTTTPPCDGFALPVGPGFHDMLPFGVGRHLGNDWTADGADAADLGAPVRAIANGVVIEARDIGGDWGNVVRIVHCGVEAIYAHLERIDVRSGAAVKRGDIIGTLGDADGTYSDPHLHLELRDRPLPLGGGYDDDTTGYLDPTAYIRSRQR